LSSADSALAKLANMDPVVMTAFSSGDEFVQTARAVQLDSDQQQGGAVQQDSDQQQAAAAGSVDPIIITGPGDSAAGQSEGNEVIPVSTAGEDSTVSDAGIEIGGNKIGDNTDAVTDANGFIGGVISTVTENSGGVITTGTEISGEIIVGPVGDTGGPGLFNTDGSNGIIETPGGGTGTSEVEALH